MTAGRHSDTSDELEPARHADPWGPAKGWNAADVQPGELSGDDYADQFPEVGDGPQ